MPPLSPRQFHGSNHVFQAGDSLLPGNEVNGGSSQHGSLVWSTDDPKWAAAHGDHVYEVEHQGLSQRNPGVHGATVSLGATIKGKVKV